MTNDQEIADTSRLVMAFVRARMEDNEVAGIALAKDGNGTVLLLGLADLCIAQIQMLAEIMGVTPERFFEVMFKENLKLAASREMT